MNVPVSAILERKGRQVFSVPPDITIAEAVAEMNRQRVGCVLVLEDGKVVGIFTERDVLRRVVGEAVDPRTVPVRQVMTPEVMTISPQTTIEETMVIFTERRFRHLPVCDHGELVGTISIGDVTRWNSDENQAEAQHLKNYISGVPS